MSSPRINVVDLRADDLDAYEQIPVPGSLALLPAGLGGLAGAATRRRREG